MAPSLFQTHTVIMVRLVWTSVLNEELKSMIVLRKLEGMKCGLESDMIILIQEYVSMNQLTQAKCKHKNYPNTRQLSLVRPQMPFKTAL